MNFFYEILPVFLFFIAFKWYGMYVATIVGIISTAIQVILYRLYTKKWDKVQLFTLLIFLIFGGMTLYFHNPIFVKWKPTILFWMFATVILITHIFMKKFIIRNLLQNAIQENYFLPEKVWATLNLYWALFLVILGAINLYVAYNYDTNVWVNFKFYGITLALVVFSISQMLYLMRHMVEIKHE